MTYKSFALSATFVLAALPALAKETTDQKHKLGSIESIQEGHNEGNDEPTTNYGQMA